MKNAEKFKEIFKEFATEVWAFPEKDFLTWLNAEYKEPTTKNDLGVDCIDRKTIEKHIEDGLNSGKYGHDAVNIMTEIHFMPSVTPQLSAPEVTALAEWTEKLTKECEEAYNKGYANGMKAQDPRKGHWIEEFNDLEGEVRFTCSSCGKFQLFGTDFCYHCGADMREVEE
ncbi:hypothetical protein [Sharpea azabuensis]|uniref:hypothetical protein n=1 Tax=Sharpea azabuensis TaxID=322505 RepID=UPI00156A0E7A|nr:hypothetical protein [Sharpea azabuensis]